MKTKNNANIEIIEESLRKMMIAISYMKATGEPLYDDWLVFPADEAELQTDYMIQQIQFLKEELEVYDN